MELAAGNTAQSSQPVVNAPVAQPPPVQNQAPKEAISGAPKFEPQGQKILSKEERIEYRDQNGNLLNEEQVEALKGKVEFKTKYETRTRVLDAAGNEVAADVVEEQAGGVAPPHPDVEGVDQQTKQKDGEEVPKEASESKAGEKEAEKSVPKPASEGNEATQ